MIGRSRWFKSNASGPTGEAAVLDAAQTVAVMESRIAETLVVAQGHGADEAKRELAAHWQDAIGRGRRNALGETLRTLHVGSETEALAALLGLGLSGRRGAAMLSTHALVQGWETLIAAAAQGVPLVAHTRLAPHGASGMHDAWSALEGAGWMQFLAHDAQSAAALALVARRCAEMFLLPALVAQDAWSAGCLEPLRLPEEGVVRAFLGQPHDRLPAPTPVQALVFGEERRRVPSRWSVDSPVGGALDLAPGVASRAAAARAAYSLEGLESHIAGIMAEFTALTHLPLASVQVLHGEKADWLVLAVGAATGSALAAAKVLGERGQKGQRVGVLALNQWRPFPARRLAELLSGRKGVLVLEPAGGFSAQDGPVMREVRSVLHRCLENAQARHNAPPHPGLPALGTLPALHAALTGAGGEGVNPRAVVAAVLAMQNGGAHARRTYLEMPYVWERPETPKEEILQQNLLEVFPRADRDHLALPAAVPEPQGTVAVRVLSLRGKSPFFAEEHPAALLADLASVQVKAWRQPPEPPGSAASSALETAWLLAGPQPLPANAPPQRVDLVLCADPVALSHPDALVGLKPQGVVMMQGDPAKAGETWAALPAQVQAALAQGQAQVLLLDVQKLARAEAIAPEEQARHAGRV